MQNSLQTEIEFLKGVGPTRAEVLKSELDVYRFGDLLHYYPFRYVDRSRFYTVGEVHGDLPYIQIKGQLNRLQEVGPPRRKRLVGHFTDHTGELELVWFKGAKWVKKSLTVGADYVLFGKPTLFNGKLNVAHPELEPVSEANEKRTSSLQPVYSTTEKLSRKSLNSKGIEKLVKHLLPQVKNEIRETLSADLIARLRLMPRKEALNQIHFPSNPEALQRAQFRLKFEELFFVQLQLAQLKCVRQQSVKGFVFERVGEHFNTFYTDHLPFDLTKAQKRVVKEIRRDLGKGEQMNRLLQGDVGSGKTMVALLVMLIAIDNGFQAALMAPTEILAQQHFETLVDQLKEMPVRVELLTGSTKSARRRELHADLQNGQIHILVGTHALLEDKVKFHRLGLTVIDEQHRFGVAQRSKMWMKSNHPPHVLVMSATPIPRTLAMTLYGDLDISVIDELPPGRKPVQTRHYYENSRLKVFGFMRKEIQKGRQVYVVYPLIEESEKLELKNLDEGYEAIRRAFPEFQVGVMHGRMKPEDKDFEMQRFVKGETKIMVATTVIEVGVNVPNASVMIIENAERFGLSQLHQLRGRVGRGAEQSYCILMTDVKLSKDGKKRMETMVGTTDGFRVAEVDLQLRGPGDLMGTQQSGMLNLKLADLAKDQQILQLARHEAFSLLKSDPSLQTPESRIIKKSFDQFMKSRPNWAMIS